MIRFRMQVMSINEQRRAYAITYDVLIVVSDFDLVLYYFGISSLRKKIIAYFEIMIAIQVFKNEINQSNFT